MTMHRWQKSAEYWNRVGCLWLPHFSRPSLILATMTFERYVEATEPALWKFSHLIVHVITWNLYILHLHVIEFNLYILFVSLRAIHMYWSAQSKKFDVWVFVNFRYLKVLQDPAPFDIGMKLSCRSYAQLVDLWITAKFDVTPSSWCQLGNHLKIIFVNLHHWHIVVWLIFKWQPFLNQLYGRCFLTLKLKALLFMSFQTHLQVWISFQWLLRLSTFHFQYRFLTAPYVRRRPKASNLSSHELQGLECNAHLNDVHNASSLDDIYIVNDTSYSCCQFT